MLYRVVHVTTYAYEEPVSISHNETRVSPKRTAAQSSRRTQRVRLAGADASHAWLSLYCPGFG